MPILLLFLYGLWPFSDWKNLSGKTYLLRKIGDVLRFLLFWGALWVFFWMLYLVGQSLLFDIRNFQARSLPQHRAIPQILAKTSQHRNADTYTGFVMVNQVVVLTSYPVPAQDSYTLTLSGFGVQPVSAQTFAAAQHGQPVVVVYRETSEHRIFIDSIAPYHAP